MHSSTLSHLHSSSSTNANAFLLTKARHSIPFSTFILTICSSTPRSLFYSAQSNLPITRHLFHSVKPSGNSSVPLYPNLPNLFSCQLTAVYSLQASLDVLRKHRPDYTPRTGFVWPITDPSLSDDTSKPRKHDPNAVVPENDTLAATLGSDRRLPKREQNNILLLNAMRTTAAHSRLSYTPITTEAANNGTAAETPVPTQSCSSATPTPGSQESTSKGSPSTAAVVEITRGTTTITKKKKKRMSGLFRSSSKPILILGPIRYLVSTVCSNLNQMKTSHFLLKCLYSQAILKTSHGHFGLPSANPIEA